MKTHGVLLVLLLAAGCDAGSMREYGLVEYVCSARMNLTLDSSGYPDTRINIEFNDYGVQVWEYYRAGDSVAFSSAGGGCEVVKY